MTNTPKVEGAWPRQLTQTESLMEEVRRLTVELENAKGDLSAASEANREGMHVLGKLKAERDQLAEVIRTAYAALKVITVPYGCVVYVQRACAALSSSGVIEDLPTEG